MATTLIYMDYSGLAVVEFKLHKKKDLIYLLTPVIPWHMQALSMRKFPNNGEKHLCKNLFSIKSFL